MDLRSNVDRAWAIIKRDRAGITLVARDPGASLPGLVFLTLAVAGSILFHGSRTGPAVAALLLAPILFSVGIGILFVTAKIVGGSGGYLELWRPHAHASLLMLLAVAIQPVPGVGAFVSGLLGIYFLVVSVAIVETTQHVSRGRAVGVVLLPYAAPLLVSAAILVVAGGASGLGPFLYTIF